MADLKISQLTSASTPLAGTEVLPVVQSGSTVQVSVDNLTDGRAVKMLGAQVGTKTSATGSTISTTFSAGLASASGGTAVAATLCNTVAAANNNETQITFSPASNYSATGAIGVTIESIVSANSALKFYTYNGGLAEAARIDSSGNYIPKNAAKGINFTANTPLAGMTSQLLNWYEEGSWTIADASGAGLVLTVTNATYTKIGRTVFIQFFITYPITASAVQAAVTLPYTAFNYGQITGRFGAAVTGVWQCQSGAATAILHSINGGAAITNASLSGQYMLISGVYQST
jgi:hypothetical protein